MAGEQKTARDRSLIGIAVAGLTVLGAFWWFARSSPPQIGDNKQTVMAVDSLFTALTARDDKLLGECERRLHALKEADALSDSASTSLDGIIKTARGGGWESAAQTLYDFMKGQRRQRHE